MVTCNNPCQAAAAAARSSSTVSASGADTIHVQRCLTGDPWEKDNEMLLIRKLLDFVRALRSSCVKCVRALSGITWKRHVVPTIEPMPELESK